MPVMKVVFKYLKYICYKKTGYDSLFFLNEKVRLVDLKFYEQKKILKVLRLLELGFFY